MTTILRANVLRCVRFKSPLQCSFAHARCISRHISHYGVNQLAANSFEDLGLPKRAVTKLQTAFPNVQRPTATQQSFIPALLGGRDVILRDVTGSGKSFAMLLALWSRVATTKSTSPTLVLTPHRDLALQCAYWVYRLNGSVPEDDTSSLVQLLLRSSSEPLTDPERLTEIRDSRSPLLIGTPQAVLEVIKADASALPLQRLSTVVIDEVDSMVEIPPTGANKHAQQKFEKSLKRHPSPTRQILDMIYHQRAESDTQKPQLVMMSATLGPHSQRWLKEDSGWFENRGQGVVVVHGSSLSGLNKTITAPTTIVHHALVISPSGEVSNIDGAADVASSLVADSEDADTTISDAATRVIGPTVDEAEEYEGVPSPFNPSALEAIGLTFALEVPHVALLVLPASAAVRRAVYDLRMLGVNAQGLDILQTERGGAFMKEVSERSGQKQAEAGVPTVDLDAHPTLLVSTLATTRGLDLPELSHVFLLGTPADGSVETYAHMAGRVGRAGREGKVVSVVESGPRSKRTAGKGQKAEVTDEVVWLQDAFEQLGIRPAKLEHFE